MLGLIGILNKIYNKKVNLNIINLKYLFLENSIIADAIVRKLNDRNKRVLKVIRKALNYVERPFINLIPKIDEIENKTMDTNTSGVYNSLTYQLYNYINNNHIETFKFLNNKFLIGLRFQGTGRLTQRLTASRSILKRAYIGGLKNINSSHSKLRLSTGLTKGYMGSNIQYININSYNRNGSFGVKS
jgi:hypothetical protein